MIMLNSSIENIIENNGFTVRYNKQNDEFYAELNQLTPLGEDWWTTIFFDGTNEGFIQAVIRYYYEFDVDEEVEPLIKNRGKYGIPDSIEDLIEDAKWKEEKIDKLSDDLINLNNKENL
jgi:hypothetical protein